MAESPGQFAAELYLKAHHVEREAKAVVKRGANNVKKDWKRLFTASEEHRSARLYPSSISYDELGGGGLYHAEIGPDKSRPQGALGNLIEFGSVNNVGQNHGGRALEIETAKFIDAMTDLGDFE